MAKFIYSPDLTTTWNKSLSKSISINVPLLHSTKNKTLKQLECVLPVQISLKWNLNCGYKTWNPIHTKKSTQLETWKTQEWKSINDWDLFGCFSKSECETKTNLQIKQLWFYNPLISYTIRKDEMQFVFGLFC